MSCLWMNKVRVEEQCTDLPIVLFEPGGNFGYFAQEVAPQQFYYDGDYQGCSDCGMSIISVEGSEIPQEGGTVEFDVRIPIDSALTWNFRSVYIRSNPAGLFVYKYFHTPTLSWVDEWPSDGTPDYATLPSQTFAFSFLFPGGLSEISIGGFMGYPADGESWDYHDAPFYIENIVVRGL